MSDIWRPGALASGKRPVVWCTGKWRGHENLLSCQLPSQLQTRYVIFGPYKSAASVRKLVFPPLIVYSSLRPDLLVRTMARFAAAAVILAALLASLSPAQAAVYTGELLASVWASIVPQSLRSGTPQSLAGWHRACLPLRPLPARSPAACTCQPFSCNKFGLLDLQAMPPASSTPSRTPLPSPCPAPSSAL